jgi:hypothetical protein
MGGIDTRHLLTEGTPEEIDAAVREYMRTLAAGVRYGRYPIEV